MSGIIDETDSFTECACGHSRDWHHLGDILWCALFGTKLGSCTHYVVVGKDLPFWKRKRVYCGCSQFRSVKR
jgi:hypothetical protein